MIERATHAHVGVRLARRQDGEAHRPQPGLRQHLEPAHLLQTLHQVRRHGVDQVDAAGLERRDARRRFGNVLEHDLVSFGLLPQ